MAYCTVGNNLIINQHIKYYSLRPILGVPFSYGTGFKNLVEYVRASASRLDVVSVSSRRDELASRRRCGMHLVPKRRTLHSTILFSPIAERMSGDGNSRGGGSGGSSQRSGGFDLNLFDDWASMYNYLGTPGSSPGTQGPRLDDSAGVPNTTF